MLPGNFGVKISESIQVDGANTQLSTVEAYRVKYCDVLFDIIILYKLINY